MTMPSDDSTGDPRPDPPLTDQVASFGEKHSGRIRLGCLHCDRDDFDGVDELPADWGHVAEVQRWEAAIRPDKPTDDGQSVFDWQTHLGVCPQCDAEYETKEKPVGNSESDDPGEKDFRDSLSVHPIIRQIIDRDCHVGEAGKAVVRHVISKLRDGYQTFRALTKAERRQFIEQCLNRHRANRRQYVEVMSGFTRTIESDAAAQGSITGQEVAFLMRKHRKTIAQLAFRLGTSRKRVRQVRLHGLYEALAVRDWIQAITDDDPGPIPVRYFVNGRQEETDCCFCGFPLITGDNAYEYVREVFCSVSCCRKSRGW